MVQLSKLIFILMATKIIQIDQFICQTNDAFLSIFLLKAFKVLIKDNGQ